MFNKAALDHAFQTTGKMVLKIGKLIIFLEDFLSLRVKDRSEFKMFN